MPYGPDNLDRLYHEQRLLREYSAALVELAERIPPPDRATLASARWLIARTLMRHLPLKDRLVYARLRLHPDRSVAVTSERFSREAHAIFDGFLRHVERWTPALIETDWTAYRTTVRRAVAELDDRIAREEAHLLPHLATAPELPPTRCPGDRNWAAEGWRIRTLLGIDGDSAAAA